MLRLNFSHLNEHKFRHGFRDTVDPMCQCGLETEITLSFLSCCSLYPTVSRVLLKTSTAASSVTNYLDEELLNILLYRLRILVLKQTNQCQSLQLTF